MKKIIAGLCLAVAAAAFAAQNNLIITFSTQTADTYADGTPVLNGELYALVWVPSGKTFAGVAADCTPIDATTGDIVQVRPRVMGKKYYKPIKFEVQADEVAKRTKGSWKVYLLDTRVYGAGGGVTVGNMDANGRPAAVNAAKAVSDASVSAMSGANTLAGVTAAKATCANEATALPAETPNPEITGISVVDGEVHLKVSGTVPYVQYNIAGGETPDAVGGKKAKAPKNGVAGGEIELVAPAGTGARFFRVNRN